MREISQIGKEMLKFQAKLAAEQHYKPVEPDLFLGDVRDKYRETLPEWCNVNGDSSVALYSLDDTLISTGYTRIVIGDYGAFIEISPKQINKSILICKKGQEYRYNEERYSSHIKYLWLTANDKSDCKIYYQQKCVDYADYQPNMFYISPFEVYTKPL